MHGAPSAANCLCEDIVLCFLVAIGGAENSAVGAVDCETGRVAMAGT